MYGVEVTGIVMGWSLGQHAACDDCDRRAEGNVEEKTCSAREVEDSCVSTQFDL